MTIRFNVFFIAVLFAILKVLGVISWSWVWVLSPIWIPYSIILVFYIFVFIMSFFVIAFGCAIRSR
jgi:hypothetical protein